MERYHDIIPQDWRPNERYIAVCAKCGRELLKKNMAQIYVKEGSVSTIKILCHFCVNCYAAFLDDVGISGG